MRPLLLDAYCCAGGAGKGYYDAGFDVIGLDIVPQPNYPFEFIQADAVDFIRKHGREFAAHHTSPPCQGYSAMQYMPDARVHPKLVEATREALESTGRPWVIENVVGAPLRDSIVLCGSMFGLGAAGFSLRRHRQFESNLPLTPPGPCVHTGPTIGIYGGHVRCRSAKYWRAGGADFPGYDKKALASEAMGIDWMTMGQMSEAVPPRFTEHLGRQLLQHLNELAA